MHLVFENTLEEKLIVNMEGATRIVKEMERKLERLLWTRGQWSVKIRKLS